MPLATMVSNANSTPALTIAIINTPWSKYSCSLILPSYFGAFSKAVLPVSSRHFNRFASPFAQSSIITRENSPLMISSMCLANKNANSSLICSANSNARNFALLDKRSIINVIPPCFKASVMVSQPYCTNLPA